MAEAVAPLGDFENKKFFLPITKGFIALSALLLLISNPPSNINASNFLHWFKQYLIAFPKALLGRTCFSFVFSHNKKSSRTGLLCSRRVLYRSSKDKSFKVRSILKSSLQKSTPFWAVVLDFIESLGSAFKASVKPLLAWAKQPTWVTSETSLYPAYPSV